MHDSTESNTPQPESVDDSYSDDALPEGDTTDDEIEQAYQLALEAMEALESDGDLSLAEPDNSEAVAAETFGPPTEPSDSVEETFSSSETNQTENGFDLQSATAELSSLGSSSRISPDRVIEAALFVGGNPLTAKKICSFLSEQSNHEFVDRAIENLNRQYLSENRPYEIRLTEGGYRMELRPDFERIRNRVFGFGPKEVRLTQDALEILALVAYKQPLQRNDLDKTGKKNVGSIVNQLVRRELVGIERDKKSRKKISYHTTDRFLKVFGIGSVDELPQADDLSIK